MSDVSQLSPEEIERMREIVLAADGQKQPAIIDINNPPRVPYVHQEFPRMVYHHKDQKTLIVKNEKELAEAEKHGFEKQAFVAEVVEEEQPPVETEFKAKRAGKVIK